MNNLVTLKYYLCEGTIIVRLIDNVLERYEPRIEGWIENPEWYQNMFTYKRVNFIEIQKEDAINLMKESIKYYKRTDGTYVRRVYNVYVELLDSNTLEWKSISGEWDKDMFFDGLGKSRVSKMEVDSYIKSLKPKKMRR